MPFTCKCSAKSPQNTRAEGDFLTIFVFPQKRKQPPSRAVESNYLNNFCTAKLINNSHTGKQMKGKNTTSRGFFRLALIKSAEGWENAGLTAQNQNPKLPFRGRKSGARFPLFIQNFHNHLSLNALTLPRPARPLIPSLQPSCRSLISLSSDRTNKKRADQSGRPSQMLCVVLYSLDLLNQSVGYCFQL